MLVVDVDHKDNFLFCKKKFGVGVKNKKHSKKAKLSGFK
jgi:hypothetical protein